MAAQIPVVSGGLSYTAPSYSYGMTTSNTGGLNFDLPLASVAAFTNTALNFSADNTQNAQGFLSGVIANSQSAVSSATSQSFSFQNSALGQLLGLGNNALDVQKYAIKKQSALSLGPLGLSGGCFITTAVTQASGKPDDCMELQTLRKFRDEFLLATEDGTALVKHYYAVAPTIVDAIKASPQAASTFNYLAQNFIYPAIQHIGAGNPAEAAGLYMAMVGVAHVMAGSPVLPTVAVEVPPAVTEPVVAAPVVEPVAVPPVVAEVPATFSLGGLLGSFFNPTGAPASVVVPTDSPTAAEQPAPFHPLGD